MIDAISLKPAILFYRFLGLDFIFCCLSDNTLSGKGFKLY